MVDQMLAEHIAFKKLQDEASEAGLTLTFDHGRFILSVGESRKFKDVYGNVGDLSEKDVSRYSHETLSACISTWKFCRNYHEYDNPHQPTVD